MISEDQLDPSGSPAPLNINPYVHPPRIQSRTTTNSTANLSSISLPANLRPTSASDSSLSVPPSANTLSSQTKLSPRHRRRKTSGVNTSGAPNDAYIDVDPRLPATHDTALGTSRRTRGRRLRPMGFKSGRNALGLWDGEDWGGVVGGEDDGEGTRSEGLRVRKGLKEDFEVPGIRVEAPQSSVRGDPHTISSRSDSDIPTPVRSARTPPAFRRTSSMGEHSSERFSAPGYHFDEQYEKEFPRWRSGYPYEYLPRSREHWERCADLATVHDNEMCNTWKAEIDNLVIFAGLFTAAVTAFTIESYKWLQPDATEYNAQVLALIYGALDPENARNKLSTLQDPMPQNPVVRINIYWFLSLTLGLTTVLLGIISAQWLREYQRHVPGTAKERLALRQMRFEGLMYWQVPRIIAVLPSLLQAGFILFLLGIVELVWILDTLVAVPVTALVGCVLLLLLATLLMPMLQWLLPGDQHLRIPQCPFKSPQSLGLLRFTIKSLAWIPRFTRWVLGRGPSFFRTPDVSWTWNWVDHDRHWRTIRDIGFSEETKRFEQRSDDLVHGLAWVVSSFHATIDTTFDVLHCIHEMPFDAAKEVVRLTSSHLLGRSVEGTVDVFADGDCNGVQHEPEVQQDILTAAFLQDYYNTYPGVRVSYWESVIRLMNYLPFKTRTTPLPMVFPHELPENVILQLLSAFHSLIENDAATPKDIENMWNLLSTLLSPSVCRLRVPQIRFSMISDLFLAIESWLNRSNERVSKEFRAWATMNGLARLVYPGFRSLCVRYAGYHKLESLVLALDQDMGAQASADGDAPMLHEVWDRCYSYVFLDG